MPSLRAEGENTVWEVFARLIPQTSSVHCTVSSAWGGGRAAEQRLRLGLWKEGRTVG